MDMHDVSETIIAPAVATPAIGLRWGVVTAVAFNGTLTLTLGGGAATVTGITALSHVKAEVAATVVLVTIGADMFALGKL